MKSSKNDPKVKKTFVRNPEIKMKCSQITHETNDKRSGSCRTQTKEIILNQPSLCSSELLFNYIGEVKKTTPPKLAIEDIKESDISMKITRKLNFHINDKMYKNLVKLNTSIEEEKNKNKTRTTSDKTKKKDLEPNINDFYQDFEEQDTLPTIPVIKSKFKSIQPTDNGRIHKLVSSFENL